MIIASMYPCPFDIQDRHDVNSSIYCNGKIFSYEEDKLTTIKNESTVKYPERSLMMGLKELNILPSKVNKWVFPTPKIMPSLDDFYFFFSWILKAYVKDKSNFKNWFNKNVLFIDHHISHVSLAAISSPFSDCFFISQDGGGDLGDPRNLLFGNYKNGNYDFLNDHYGYNSVCTFHGFLTDSLGFSGENGKTSGLASYGKIKNNLKKSLNKLFCIDGSGLVFERVRYKKTKVNLSKVKPQEYSRVKIFNQYPSDTNVFRCSASFLPHDIAATGEKVLQDNFLKLIRSLKRKYKIKSHNIVLSGGLFQNVALNRAIIDSGLFKNVFIPMSPSDSGLSLGACLYVAENLSENNNFINKEYRKEEYLTPYLGPSFQSKEVIDVINNFNLLHSSPYNICKTAATLISQGFVVGWFQGRAEFGPRSLGARSILGDPRNLNIKARINQTLKRRDWFMPYAPAILKEFNKEWTIQNYESPYMQAALNIKNKYKKLIPAAIHVDGTARVQTVSKNNNYQFWKLINYFYKITGVPLVLNTSFNRHGISTISSPRQAIEHLVEGCMDYLFIDNYLISLKDNRNLLTDISPNSDDFDEEEKLIKVQAIERLVSLHPLTDRSTLKNYINNLATLLNLNISYDGSYFLINKKKYSSFKKFISAIVNQL